jgi:hypothetical protein
MFNMGSSEASGSTPSIIFRLGLATAGGICLSLASDLAGAASPPQTTVNILAMIALGGLGLSALAVCAVRRPPLALRWLILTAYLMQVLVPMFIWVQRSNLPDLVSVDVGLNSDLAGTLIRHGQNPYSWNYSGIDDLYRMYQRSGTPLLNAATVSRYSYPALIPLLVVPIQAIGLPGVFTLSVLAHLASLILIFQVAPRRWQPVILLPAIAGFDFVVLSVIGLLDIVWLLVVIGMVVAWRRPTLRALLFGLAISLKQLPALLTPFLLIRLWKEDEPGQPLDRLRRFILISASVFIFINGPFLIWNPSAWLAGYTDPVRSALVILSYGGLSTLAQGGILYLPKLYFLCAALTVFGLLLFIYWRHHNALRDALWIFPGIALWFSYRSLEGYWMYWAFPMLLAVVTRRPTVKLPDRYISWKPSLSLMFGAALLLVVLGGVLGSRDGHVKLRLQLPMTSHSRAVDHLSVEVKNLGDHAITPRFAIQSRSTWCNPLPWYIEDGPLTLSPGQAAVYAIGSHRTDATFNGAEPVQLVVSDAGGDYSLRGLLTIEPDPAFKWPEMILNADYRIWSATQGLPLWWLPSNLRSASLVDRDGRLALQLSALPTSDVPSQHSLYTSFLDPGVPFGIWLYPAEGRVSNAYGLEVYDGTNRLWLLFGPQPYTGQVPLGAHVLQRLVSAGAWTYEEIDLSAAYAEAGVSLPPLRHTNYRGLEIDARVIRLGLFFTTDRSTAGETLFGPIIQSSEHPTPQALMAETLSHPADYYARLGNEYELQGNYGLALEAYQHALRFAPGDTGMLASIEGLKRLLAGEPQ